jgi:hypothetical protein
MILHYRDVFVSGGMKQHSGLVRGKDRAHSRLISNIRYDRPYIEARPEIRELPVSLEQGELRPLD